ncbi:MAG: hypothetical protein WAK60_08895 [Sedimentisphaerales bacterium]
MPLKQVGDSIIILCPALQKLQDLAIKHTLRANKDKIQSALEKDCLFV